MSEMDKIATPGTPTAGATSPPPTDASAPPDESMPEGEEAPPRGVRMMAIVRWGLVVLMALAALAALNYRYGWLSGGESPGESDTVYYCPMHPSVQQDHPGECPICSMTLVPKPKPGDAKAEEAAKAEMQAQVPATTGEYYCPMHPEVTSTDPNAVCEQCGGMKLEPKPAGVVAPPQGAEGVPGLVPVTLSQDRIQLIGMRTAVVKREALAPELRTVGIVAPSERGLAVIQTRFAGWIEVLKVEQTGQKVRKGQVLATIYSPELLVAQQEYLNALKWANKPGGGQASDLSADLARDARKRLELLGISDTEIDAIERTREAVRAIAIRSPVGGYVIEKNAVQGADVQPGAVLFQVADLSTVWVLADVYEYEIDHVKVGQPASVELASYGGEKFAGKVTFVYPSLNAATRTLRVRLELENPGLRLRPGMYGNVLLQSERTDALVVPAEAVVDTGTVQYAFVALPEGKFEPRKIKVGAQADGKVQVLDGLAEGETVVTTANFLLDSESRLQAAILGGDAGGKPAPGGDVCVTDFDKEKYPDKYQQCVACRAHRGMGTMEDDCRKQIPKPWK